MDVVYTIGNYQYRNHKGNIIIPPTVKSIGYCAFCNSDVTDIVIPDSVESIGMYAFNKCYNFLRMKILF